MQNARQAGTRRLGQDGATTYRTALDHPGRVDALAVLDVLPVDAVWDRADDRLALGFWPWSLLAQPEPLPEQLIAGAPGAVTGNAFSGAWGSPAGTFGEQVRAACTAALRDPDRIHAICEEYRAAAGIDRDHDAADRAAGRVITCPVLVLWSASGPLGSWYHHDGGPLALWRQLAPDVTGAPVQGGHFFPEEQPAATAATLTGFFARTLNHPALPPPAAVSTMSWLMAVLYAALVRTDWPFGCGSDRQPPTQRCVQSLRKLRGGSVPPRVLSLIRLPYRVRILASISRLRRCARFFSDVGDTCFRGQRLGDAIAGEDKARSDHCGDEGAAPPDGVG